MKLKYGICFAICCFAAFSCAAANADCGKIWIYPFDWGGFFGGQPYYPQPLPGTGSTTDLPPYRNTPEVGGININNNNNNNQQQQLQEIENLRKDLNDLRVIIDQLKQSLQPSTPPTPLPPDPPSPSEPLIPTPGDTDPFGSGVPDFVPAPDGGGASGLGAVFHEPQQQAVIAWNGKMNGNGRETLVLTTNEESTNGKRGVLLSVLPLPGKPLEVRPANINTFAQAKALFFSKPHEGSGGSRTPIYEKNISPHYIFVWELENVETFQKDVQAWIAQKFNNQAAALITDETVHVLQYYFRRGFKYFAFDLTEVGQVSTKQAIAYTFVSSHVYFPLVISRIGGSNRPSTVDLLVMTPYDLSLTINGAITDAVPTGKLSNGLHQAELVRGGSVRFSIDEVRKLDPALDVFDPGTANLRVRNFKFTKPLNSYTKDFTAVADQK